MDYLTLESVEQFHNIFRCYRSHNGLGNWFRGQENSEWELLPKAGRKEHFLLENRDLGRFKDWENQAIAYGELPENRLERLAIAQHHGLATRMLDWTQNPLVAAYFAVTSSLDKEGAIFILEILEDLATEDTHFDVVKNHEGVIGYLPRALSPRVLNQKGLFTIHCPANQKIDIKNSRIANDHLNLKKILIPSKLKLDIEKMLNDYGVNASTLFPDLDGLSKQIDRETQKMVSRNAT
jgi:hypothetical protein